MGALGLVFVVLEVVGAHLVVAIVTDGILDVIQLVVVCVGLPWMQLAK